MPLTGIYHVLGAILGGAAILNVGGQFLMLSRVRWGHPDVWRSLGEPRFFMWPYSPLAKRYRAFVSSKELAHLHDSLLLIVRQTVNVSGWVVAVVFPVCVGLQWFAHAS